MIFAMFVVLLRSALLWLGWHLSELLSIYLMLEAEAEMQKGKQFKMGNLGGGIVGGG
jgi:hypothetical protein